MCENLYFILYKNSYERKKVKQPRSAILEIVIQVHVQVCTKVILRVSKKNVGTAHKFALKMIQV